MNKSIFATIILMFSTMALAQWKHVTFTSAEDIQIEVAYQVSDTPITCYKCTSYTYADPIWVNVSGRRLNSNLAVRAVLMNITNHDGMNEETVATQIIDLEYADAQRFSGLAPKLLIKTSNYGWLTHSRQEIAVVINGQWLRNPANGKSNFNLKLE